MKHVIFPLMVLLSIFTGCSKDESKTSNAGEQTINASALPVKATEYIADNYPAETITAVVQVTNGTATYIVALNTLEQLAFDHNGGFLGNGAYFHPGHDSIGFDHDSTGFDHDSLNMHGGPGHGGHHGGPGHGEPGHGEPGGPGHGMPGNISSDSLPASVAEYIAANFIGYNIQHAEIRPNCQFYSIYEVMLVKDTLHPVKVCFGLSGNYLLTSNRASYTIAPQPVKDLISTNYPGYRVMQKMEVLTMADNTTEYSIFIDKQHDRKSVLLNADGTFICEK